MLAFRGEFGYLVRSAADARLLESREVRFLTSLVFLARLLCKFDVETDFRRV